MKSHPWHSMNVFFLVSTMRMSLESSRWGRSNQPSFQRNKRGLARHQMTSGTNSPKTRMDNRRSIWMGAGRLNLYHAMRAPTSSRKRRWSSAHIRTSRTMPRVCAWTATIVRGAQRRLGSAHTQTRLTTRRACASIAIWLTTIRIALLSAMGVRIRQVVLPKRQWQGLRLRWILAPL